MNQFNLQACLCEPFSSFARLRSSPLWVHRLSIDYNRTSTAIFEDIAHASTRYVSSTNALWAVDVRRRHSSHSISCVQVSSYKIFSAFIRRRSHPYLRRTRGIGTLGELGQLVRNTWTMMVRALAKRRRRMSWQRRSSTKRDTRCELRGSIGQRDIHRETMGRTRSKIAKSCSALWLSVSWQNLHIGRSCRAIRPIGSCVVD
jgi:hypothetical protein